MTHFLLSSRERGDTHAYMEVGTGTRRPSRWPLSVCFQFSLTGSVLWCRIRCLPVTLDVGTGLCPSCSSFDSEFPSYWPHIQLHPYSSGTFLPFTVKHPFAYLYADWDFITYTESLN